MGNRLAQLSEDKPVGGAEAAAPELDKQLLKAAGAGDEQMVEELLKKRGVSPDVTDDHGNTPLHLAAAQLNACLVSVLHWWLLVTSPHEGISTQCLSGKCHVIDDSDNLTTWMQLNSLLVGYMSHNQWQW